MLRRLTALAALALALAAPGAASASPQHALPYAGVQLQGRDVVTLVAPHFPNSKVKALATAFAESQLYLGAWHDNFASDGITLLSRDCGLYQINIPARYVGTLTEDSLRTGSGDPAIFLAVARHNVDAAYELWSSPWVRDGHHDVRRWQAWVAYNSGWAMFGQAWVWHQADGNPIGPWVATGRYLHKAIRAVANWHLKVAQDMNPEQALAEAQRLAAAYGAEGELRYSDKLAVYWVYPTKPTAPPADGVGPRPIPNNGF